MSRADMRRAWKERPISTFFATGLGIGMLPFAPGTWGSLEGLALAALVNWRYGNSFSIVRGLSIRFKFEFENAFTLISLTAMGILALGVVLSGRTEVRCDSKDPSQIVIDEVAGQMIASAPCALMKFQSPWWLWFVSFALFRLFDIWKPWPIRRLEKLPGGWGIMLDDVAAGIFAGALTYAAGRFI